MPRPPSSASSPASHYGLHLHILRQPARERLGVVVLDAEERLLQRKRANIEASAGQQLLDTWIHAEEALRERLAVARGADQRGQIGRRVAQSRAAPVDDAADRARSGVVEDV